jgi:hypothetical protein
VCVCVCVCVIFFFLNSIYVNIDYMHIFHIYIL